MNNKLETIETKDDLFRYFLGEIINLEKKDLVDFKHESEIDFKCLKLRRIRKIIFDKNEDSILKLTNIFSTISSIGSDIVLILNSTSNKLNYYIGVYDSNIKQVNYADETLESVFNSNFTGCLMSDTIKEIKNEDFKLVSDVLKNENIKITMTNTIPSLKEKDNKNDKFIQGLEKFILAMEDKDYTAIFLAKNATKMLENKKEAYEELYSTLFPFSNKDLILGTNSSKSIGESTTLSISSTINNSITKTISKSETTQNPSYLQKIQMFGIPFAGGVAQVAKYVKLDFDKGNESFKSKTESYNESDGRTESKAETKGLSKGESITDSYGKSEQTTIKFENKFIKNQLDAINKHLDRINQSKNYGMYDFCAYFLSEDKKNTIIAANIYKSLVRGDESYIESSHINTFDSNKSKIIRKYLSKFEHPKFNIDGEELTISSLINSKELAISLNIPKKSTNGLLIKETVEFGREILNKEDINTINIGNIYHLGKEYKKQAVSFNLKDLTMHTFITGSTGSGKSTTTYKLLNELKNKKMKFLVIEPTKGEYKHIFGNEKDVKVYGTNNKYSPLLRINPFSFPHNEIHVLEHVDRLVEIFNACWPMYAAMPVILKDAILKSYENCGWDLDESFCDNNNFPTFSDVLSSIDFIMNSKSYSDNTKSDYKGALSTRIESLTKGLINKIFNEKEIEDEKLFEENVIVDISRVGSSETKSLIMGILLLKLQEYRIAKGEMNSNLKHVTVLEEAHHLIPRISTEVSSESGNIKGKAVEMISNAIAEMRTYGQGFIIVDQSPNMLDISAIRNTNTKIIMRLSEIDDRTDIGKSATLTQEQIDEIPKLEQGVAVVYQNGWEEAILCKISKSEIENKKNKYTFDKNSNPLINKRRILSNVIKLLALSNTKIDKEEQEMIVKDFKNNSNKYNLWANSDEKKAILNYLKKNKNEQTIKQNANYINYLLAGTKLLKNRTSIEKEELINESINRVIIDLNEIILWQVKHLIKIANVENSNEIITFMEQELKAQNLLEKSSNNVY